MIILILPKVCRRLSRGPEPARPAHPPPAGPEAEPPPQGRHPRPPSAQAQRQRSPGPRGTHRRRARGSFLWRERSKHKTAQHQRGNTRRATSARTPAEPEPAEGAERAHTHTVPTHRQLFSIKAVYVPLPLALPNIRQATEPAPRLELEGEPEHLVVPRIEQRPHPKHAVVLCRDVLERQKVCLCAILPSQASD